LHRASSLLYPIECPRENIDDIYTIEQRLSSGETNDANVDTSSNNNNSEPNNTKDDIAEVLDSSPIDTARNNVMRRPTRQATLKAKKINEWLNPSENFICVRSVAIHIGSCEN